MKGKYARYGMWLVPLFMVIAILAVYLTLERLPAGTFGTEWATIREDMWAYLPWLILFGLSLYTLVALTRRRNR